MSLDRTASTHMKNSENWSIRQSSKYLINEGSSSTSTLSDNEMLILPLFCIVAFVDYYVTTRKKKITQQAAW